MEKLTIGTFTRSVLIDLARSTGALENAGLAVDEEAVTSSPAQFRALAERRYDAIVTNPDNALAYRFLDANPLSRRIDVVVTAALDRGLGLTLCLRPGLRFPDAQSNLRVGVDVATSGFALMAFALLERAGIATERVEIVTLGATPTRARALIAGECDATILNAGNELRAVAYGCSAHSRASDIGPYLGAVLARLADAEKAPAADRLATVLVAVGARILSGRLTEVLTESAERLLGLSAAQAREHARVFESPRHGTVHGGVVDRASLETLLHLRARYLPSPQLAQASERLGELVVGLAAGTTA